jgi:ribosome-associated translation inhibitor RaiA
MQIQINTDRNIEGEQALSTHVSGVVKSALTHFSEHITRVEVYLSDVNGNKVSKDDKHCVIEVRLEGRQPLVASHSAETLHQAADGAAVKIARGIESKLGKENDHKTRHVQPLAVEPIAPEE